MSTKYSHLANFAYLLKSMICHKCKKEIGLTKQVAEADKNYYEGVSAPIMLMLWCNTCDKQTAMVEIHPLEDGDFEEVESPLGTVKIPNLTT